MFRFYLPGRIRAKTRHPQPPLDCHILGDSTYHLIVIQWDLMHRNRKFNLWTPKRCSCANFYSPCCRTFCQNIHKNPLLRGTLQGVSPAISQIQSLLLKYPLPLSKFHVIIFAWSLSIPLLSLHHTRIQLHQRGFLVQRQVDIQTTAAVGNPSKG